MEDIEVRLSTRLQSIGKLEQVALASQIIKQEEALQALVKIGLGNKKNISWHACWVIIVIADNYKGALKPYMNQIIEALPLVATESQVGSLLRAITSEGFDTSEHAALFDFCLSIFSIDRQMFIYSYALDVLHEFCIQQRELHQEVLLVLEQYSVRFDRLHLIRKVEKIKQIKS